MTEVLWVPLLLKVWDILKSKGPARGLMLNPAKCEWSWLNSECEEPCPIPGVPLVPTSEISMLGVPMGSGDFCSKYVSKKLLARLIKTMDQLMDFEDSQTAMFLMRTSYSMVRATHFMRTTPVGLWGEEALEFDALVHKTAEGILGFPLQGDAWVQACLTPKFGGLGLRRVVDHSRAAYAASWYQSQSTSGEEWEIPRMVSKFDRVTQKVASFEIDQKIYEGLVEVRLRPGQATPAAHFRATRRCFYYGGTEC
jgi:hypothetical protein